MIRSVFPQSTAWEPSHAARRIAGLTREVPELNRSTTTCCSGNLVQLVTDATNRQHVARIFRISLQLFAEAIDMWVDVALVAFVIRAPNSIEQSIPGPCATRFRREQLENLKLERSQVNAKTVANDFMPPLINDEVADFDSFAIRFGWR